MHILSILVLCLSLIAVHAVPLKNSTSKRDIAVKSSKEFCVFLPPTPGGGVAETEDNGIPFCTMPNLGGSLMPSGFIKSAHFKSFPDYSQVTGTINRDAYKLKASDEGGQYDHLNRGSYTCNGYPYFVNVLEPDSNLYCIRCCKNKVDCKTGISTQGCKKIVPGSY
ncbi:hypothetical protein BDB01DRAFT_799829 [Pilobolus umbonatus]|nr:hypothetical protein BDB01DRAFT_799829 [Pilobolus umbonatus]